MSDEVVIFEEVPLRGGRRLGLARLNAPRALNALSRRMIEALDQRLSAWAEDDEVAAVWLEGAGDKAFCAGGDIVALYRAIGEGAEAATAFTGDYFAAEYRLDHRIHTYPKPVLVWGDGIVMGGGLGLMAGASHRLATETTRIAMPEITIGLYPDIGASWFLGRMAPGIGAYLGLTGAQLNARDALDLGLADRLVPRETREALLAALGEADFASAEASAVVDGVLDRFEAREDAPAAQLWPHFDHLQSLTARGGLNEAVARILADQSDAPWLAANRRRLAEGCPLSAHLAWAMIQRHRHGSLAQAFREELSLSVRCCVEGDLGEGVRALLIDKDKSPRWSHAGVTDVSEAVIDAFLSPLWPEESHPLRDL